MQSSTTFDDALARLNALYTNYANERLVNAIISAARDGIITAYQRELDIGAATEAVLDMARNLLANIDNVNAAIEARRHKQ